MLNKKQPAHGSNARKTHHRTPYSSEPGAGCPLTGTPPSTSSLLYSTWICFELSWLVLRIDAWNLVKTADVSRKYIFHRWAVGVINGAIYNYICILYSMYTNSNRFDTVQTARNRHILEGFILFDKHIHDSVHNKHLTNHSWYRSVHKNIMQWASFRFVHAAYTNRILVCAMFLWTNLLLCARSQYQL